MLLSTDSEKKIMYMCVFLVLFSVFRTFKIISKENIF